MKDNSADKERGALSAEKIYHPGDKEIDLIELTVVLWGGRWKILVVAVAAGLMGFFVALAMPNIYRSEVLLAPSTTTNDAFGGVANKYGNLASLAGFDISGIKSNGVDKTTLTLEVLESRAFIINFVRSRDLVVPLLAAKAWDAGSGEWEIDQDIYDQTQGEWLRGVVSGSMSPVPSDQEIYKKFSEEVLHVSRDSESGMISVAINLMSPEHAQQWLIWIISEVNQHMRTRDVDEAQKNIEYLQENLNQTSVTEMQQIFYQLIEEQTKMMMLAKVKDEYVLTVIDPAYVPEEPVWPSRIKFLLVSVMLGLIIGSLYFLVKHLLKNAK